MSAAGAPQPTLVVFSHIRWNFVFRRPQQLLSRLAGRWRVVFVEEPVFGEFARLEVTSHGSHLSVLVPHTPVAAPGFHDDQLVYVEPLLAQHFAEQRLAGAVAWLYTPMALPLLKALQPRCVVYDCIDEHSASKGATQQLQRRESALMRMATLVLTGGPSLYSARHELHPNMHCLPSAVDSAHFSPAALRHDSPLAGEARALHDKLAGPRLGFFGVIDDRLDLPLLERLARSHPSWHIVLAGPVVGIDPARLPRRANLHWLGAQPYERLPYLLNDWDLALMPFLVDESTRFISPGKTLEYMAGETPVVSTAVRDVIMLYGDAVEIAHSHGEFIQHCERVLDEPQARRGARAMLMMLLVWTSSWQRTADSVHTLLHDAMRRARRPEAAAAVC